jgi:hypothetical protein
VRMLCNFGNVLDVCVAQLDLCDNLWHSL